MNKLDKIPKQNPFRVPENYFEEFSKKILAATSEAETTRTNFRKVIGIRNILAIAASVIVIIMLSISVFYTNKNKERNITSIDLNSEEVIETIISDIDIITLEQEISDSWFMNGLTEAESEEIIDYLINENIDPAEIYELL